MFDSLNLQAFRNKNNGEIIYLLPSLPPVVSFLEQEIQLLRLSPSKSWWVSTVTKRAFDEDWIDVELEQFNNPK